MADQTITKQAQAVTEQAVEAVKAPVVAAVKIEKAAEKAVEKTVAKAVKPATKPVRKAAKRRAKAPAKAVKTIKRVSAARKAAAPKIERTLPMTYDFTKLFAGFELPAADRFQTIFADAGERGQELVKKSQKSAEELTELAKANIEALTEAGRIAASGVKSLGQDALASGREGFEQASASLKTLADAKSPTEFFQIQSDLARTSFDRAVAEGSKFAEAMVKLAGEAVQPLSNRATINAERINELAA